MSFFYGFFYSLLLPPTGFLTLAVIGLMVCGISKRNRTGRVMLGAGLVLLVASSLPVVSSLLYLSLETTLSAPAAISTTPTAIVVLGGDVVENAAEHSLLAGKQPGPLSMGRIRAAAILEHTSALPILITGAGISEVMRSILRAEYHVSPAKLPARWAENWAGDTWENAQYAAAILLPEGVNTVYLVTDGWHMRRAMIAFRRAGLQVVPAPVALSLRPTPIAADFLPNARSWHETYYAAHEWLGCLYYVLRD
jgi:uncharacterized SAM-binding protein YcdF (DUF218 family)